MLLNLEKMVLNWTLSKPSRALTHMHFLFAHLTTEYLPVLGAWLGPGTDFMAVGKRKLKRSL